MSREPGYCRHKATNQAYVRLNGQVIYLGEYDSEKSKERYNRLKAEWLLNKHTPRLKPKAKVVPVMADVCLAFLDHAEKYYLASDEAAKYERAIQPISELYATLPSSEFGPMHFRVCRDWWLKDSKRSRQYVNSNMRRIRTVIKWAVGQGMAPSTIVEALRCVEPLKRGRTTAKEAKAVKPIGEATVNATLPYLTQVVRDMVVFQQLVGCRPGELCSLKPSMVDRSSDVWRICLDHHKTAHHGHERNIYVGPKAQAILAKYLLRAADMNCFSPVESEKQRLEAKHAARVTPLSCGNRPGLNRVRKPRKKPGDAYSTGSYGRAIKSACRRAFPAPKGLSKAATKQWHKDHAWHPNQLRHSAGTEVRKKFGLEGAQVILGHSSADITQIYAERDEALAVSIAREVG